MEIVANPNSNKVYMLQVQRRGAKAIFEPISELFYQGMLQHQEATHDNSAFEVEAEGWVKEVLDPERPLVWVDVEGGLMEWFSVWKGKVKSASAINQAEAAAAIKRTWG